MRVKGKYWGKLPKETQIYILELFAEQNKMRWAARVAAQRKKENKIQY